MSSSKLSSKQIQENLINAISKTAEKAVSQGSFDRTILATIQYCMDKTSGQYRVKYQNAYYTAYSNEQDFIYSEGASVFVLIPQGNFKNKLFITGSASNYNGDKVYLTNLEADQQYKAVGPNIVAINGASLDLSSYKSSPDTEWEKIYQFNVNEAAFQTLKNSDYFKLGVQFKITLPDEQKTSGDYGVRLVITYQKGEEVYDKVYELNTFMMSGAPFDFTQYVPQSAYWQTDIENGKMIAIKSISGFVRYFENNDETKPDDIFVSNITLQSAKQLYDSSDSMYRVNIDSPDSFIFDNNKGYIDLVGDLYIYGNPVQDGASGLEYYWGKRDATVTSVNNPHYCEQLGAGWYCFNSSSLKKSQAQTVEDLKQEALQTLTPAEASDYQKDELAYITNQKEIQLSQLLCLGKETEIMCAIVYGGTTYYSEVTVVINPSGYYLLVGALNNETVHYNGLGYFTVAAGVFKDVEGETEPNNSKVLANNVRYQWTEYKNDITTKLPITFPPDQILLTNETWAPTRVDQGVTVNQDNEFATDEQVNQYLGVGEDFDESLGYCLERYNYYKTKADVYNTGTTEESATYARICETRRDGIISGKTQSIYNEFNVSFENTIGHYILGPSEVTAKYLEGGQEVYVNARVDTITPLDSGTGIRPAVYNTLYKLPASIVGTSATYEVSAIIYDTSTHASYSIGPKTITLTNEIGSTLDYTLEIINGDQAFIYDERGISPTSDNAIQKIPLQPLGFILRNKEGEVLFNSFNPNEGEDISLEELQPIWRFHDNSYSFIQTNYQKPVDAPQEADDGMPNTPKYAMKSSDYETTHIWELTNESQFYYKLREDFNVNYANSSNVELQICYNGAYVFGSTNFTFTKQGDLGTNGTNKSLSIYSSIYNNYKHGVLSNSKYCNFNTKVVNAEENIYDNDVRYYGPNARHLGTPYLFATDSYDDLTQGSEPCSLEDGKYVNLYIAQQPINNGQGISNASSGSFQVRWSQNSEDDTSINSASWSMPEAGWKNIGSQNFYYDTSLTLGNATGSSISVDLNRVNTDPLLSYRPSPFTFSRDGQTGTHISNNIIGVNATMVPETSTGTGRGIKTYAYCGLPYYYINWTYLDGNLSGDQKKMPSYVDPARHIVIVGGFDQVVYNGEGKNPYYTSEPFKFYMFDKNGNDITYDVLQAAKAGNALITWSCSTGLRPNAKSQAQLSNVLDFTNVNFPNDINIGQLCIKDGNWYRCTYNHKKNIQNIVEYGNGDKVTYAANSFIPAWWDEVDYRTYYQSMSFVPASSYESLISDDLFNSWIRLYIRYDVYEAEVFFPINIYCNSYESPELNEWDGKSLKVNDSGNESYLVANKVSAGIKDNQNQFVGISIGKNIRYVDNNLGGLTAQQSVGLFGFGYGQQQPLYDDNRRTQQTMFLDAVSGRAAFGTSGSTQIVLDPNPQKWSRLGGWYFSRNHLYKPVFEASDAESDAEAAQYTSIMSGEDVMPATSMQGKSFGIYVPAATEVSDDTIVMWAGDGKIAQVGDVPGRLDKDTGDITDGSNNNALANVQFAVSYGGTLKANNVFLTGDIRATSGYFGTDTDQVAINVTENDGTHYVLRHQNFWVKDDESESEVGIKGRILAKSGQIGDLEDRATGSQINTLFLNYDWYPWHYPANNEPMNDQTYYPDVNAQKIKYLLYNPNFSVVASTGEVRMKGRIYATSGRVGGWAIDSNSLMSTDDRNSVVLNSNGNATFGALSISNTGAISGPTWSIAADGTASFTNEGNVFKAQNIVTTQITAGGTTIDSTGNLTIPVGQYLRIGTEGALTAVTGSGFQFSGSLITFNLSNTALFNSDIKMGANKKISFTVSNAAIYLSENGFYSGSPGGSYYFNADGSVKARSVTVAGAGDPGTYYWDQNGNIYVNTLHVSDTTNGINIGNMTLAQYIKTIVNDALVTKEFSALIATDSVVTGISTS